MALGDAPDLSALEPIEAPRTGVHLASAPAAPSYPPEPNPFQRSPLPPNQVMQPDILRSFYTRGAGYPQTRNIPQPPSAQPAIGASGATQAITVVQQGQGPLFQTNHVSNAVQDVYDLIAGTGVTLTSDAYGGVTLTSTSTGDGLVHGETQWESDPAFVILRDDFINVASQATSPLISEMPWSTAMVSGGNAAFVNPGLPCLGSVGMNANSTAANVSVMAPVNNVSYPQPFSWPVFDYPSWKLTWIFQLGKVLSDIAAWSWSKVSFYAGLGNWCPDNAIGTTMIPRLPAGCWLRYDTDPTAPAISDTQFVFECVTNLVANSAPTRATVNPQGNVSATGIAAAENHIYRFEMLCTTVGQVKMTLLDGTTGTSYSATLSMPTWTLSPSNTTVLQTTGSNIAQFNFTHPTIGNIAAPFGPGSKINVSGITTVGYTGLNGTWNCIGGSLTSVSSIANSIFYGASIPVSGTDVHGSYSGYPALIPWFAFGNDTEATPSGGTKGVMVDYFSFIWNPGVNSSNALTPNSAKVRYW